MTSLHEFKSKIYCKQYIILNIDIMPGTAGVVHACYMCCVHSCKKFKYPSNTLVRKNNWNDVEYSN